MDKYQVTARKWRPQDLNEIIGQNHVTKALKNSIISQKIPHAYLFSGPRGIGKTSTARILSKLLNCSNSPNVCGSCRACKEIILGESLDIREIDGASNRGIDHIRDIRDNVIYTPLSLKYKIFIIDEVHMLTKEASNALLKVLEEPPSHVIFMLATTEANKVLPTIRSRCQHYLLKKIPHNLVVSHLITILDTEGYHYERSAIEEIAHAGSGSMRDSQSILDQLILYTEGNITLSATQELLGIPDSVYFEKILDGIKKQNIIVILEQLELYLGEAGDGLSFAEHFTKFLREILLVKKIAFPHTLLDMSAEKYQLLYSLSSELSAQEVMNLLNLSLRLTEKLHEEKSERFWIENTLFKMLDYKNRISLSELRQEILKIIGRDQQGLSIELKNSAHNDKKSVEKSKNAGIFSSTLKNFEQLSDGIKKVKKESTMADNFNTVEDAIKNLFEIP